MSLVPGQKIGPYEVLAQVGAGGMGEVYRARDAKLNRDVAIKVLPSVCANDPNHMARFQREANLLASLNHPHIATIYGLEESGQHRALVMELVEGPTLADRIRGGPIPEDEAFEIARQIAEGLEYAHERGIIHRDLKPANVKITPDGSVKLLDFGLAKALESEEASGSVQDSPTITMESTRAGVILGTAAYMAPEQAKGKAVDRRADIWAFGVVLFEMLTGKQLFTGETSAEVLASLMRDEPKLDPLSPWARSIVARCLRKDPRQRWQAIGDVRIAIDEREIADARAVSPFIRRPVPWIAVTVLSLLATVFFAILYFRRPPDQTNLLRFTVPLPERTTFSSLNPPALSPDGRRLAFVATLNEQSSLWIRDLDALAARQMPATEGAASPFWSPDSRYVGFFAKGQLKKLDVANASVQSLCVAPSGVGASWSKNDVILFTPDQSNVSGLFQVFATGGNVTPATRPDLSLGEAANVHPWFLPDGRHFLFTGATAIPDRAKIYVGEVGSNSRRQAISAISNATYASGYLLYLRGDTLMAQSFDATQARISGNPVPIAEQIDLAITSYFGAYGIFSASQNGVLAYIAGGSGRNTVLTWFDRSGNVLGTVGSASGMNWPTISRDGRIVAIDRLDPQTAFPDLWLHDVRRGAESRFTVNSQSNDSPVWSPNSEEIVFSSSRGGSRDLYVKAASGAMQEVLLLKSPFDKLPLDWSNDGRYIFYSVVDPSTKSVDVWVMPLFGERKPFPYLQSEFNEDNARLSPNGRWLAYSSDETGRYEIYVQSFPREASARRKWQVSTTGGYIPAWSKDGKELFYRDRGGTADLMAVPIKGGAGFEAGVPRRLFTTHVGSSSPWFDVSTDGRFLVPTQPEESARTPITVVVNWPSLIKK